MFDLFKTTPASLQFVRAPLERPSPLLPRVELSADRLTLAKRRWRARAAAGREFGLDLAEPLRHGDVFFETATHGYWIAQFPEPVLRVDLASPGQAARMAWHIGNLHFPIMPGDGFVLVEDDLALRQMFARE